MGQNSMHICEDNPSANALRVFMGLGEKRHQSNTLGKGVSVDPSSVVLNCRIASGRVGPNCVLVNVCAPSVDIEGCVLVQTTSLGPISGKDNILYNVCDDTPGGSIYAV